MTQQLSVEMHILIAIVSVVISCAFGGLVYFLKRQFELTWEKIETMTEMRIACREQLPERFADKSETKESLTRLWTRTDKIHDRVTILENRGVRGQDG